MPLPQITDTLLEHEKGSGKGPWLIQFWASWCRSCSEVFYDASKLRSKFNIRYITVSLDENPNHASSYIGRHPLKDTLIGSSFSDAAGTFSNKWKVESVPTLLVIGSNGKELARLEGHYSDAEFNHFKVRLPRKKRGAP